MVENVRAKGGEIVKEPTLFKLDGSDFTGAIVKDPDGCSFELIQADSTWSRMSTSHSLHHAMLFVTDLDRSIEFYEKVIYAPFF